MNQYKAAFLLLPPGLIATGNCYLHINVISTSSRELSYSEPPSGVGAKTTSRIANATPAARERSIYGRCERGDLHPDSAFSMLHKNRRDYDASDPCPRWPSSQNPPDYRRLLLYCQDKTRQASLPFLDAPLSGSWASQLP